MATILIEPFAVTLTLLCVLLLNMKNEFGWPVGAIAAILYFIIFLNEDLYFQTTLQAIYVIQSIYGWYIWNKLSDESQGVTALSYGDIAIHILGMIGIGISLKMFLYVRFNMEISNLDIITTFLALLANYYLSKKILQSWYLWIIVNVLMIVLLVENTLWWSVGLYSILLLFSIEASIMWTKDFRREKV